MGVSASSPPRLNRLGTVDARRRRFQEVAGRLDRDHRVSLARRLAHEFRRTRISLTAAGVAFFWLLAVFPLLIAGVGMLGLVHASPGVIADVKQAIRATVPGDGARVLERAVDGAVKDTASSGLVTVIVGTVVGLWSASSGMSAVQLGLDIAYDVPLSRSYLRRHVLGVVLVLAALVLGGASTALLVFGQPLGATVRRHLPFGGAFVPGWTVVRWGLTVLAVMTLYALFYYAGPNRRPRRWRWLSPGGLLAGGIWLASSVGFSLYVSSFGGNYARTYGSLLGVVVLVVWLYLSAVALLLGAELNGELEGPSENPADGPAGRP